MGGRSDLPAAPTDRRSQLTSRATPLCGRNCPNQTQPRHWTTMSGYLVPFDSERLQCGGRNQPLRDAHLRPPQRSADPSPVAAESGTGSHSEGSTEGGSHLPRSLLSRNRFRAGSPAERG